MDRMPDNVPVRDRRFEEVAIDKIKVINSCIRDQDRFERDLQCTDQVGLLKPICVNDQFLDRTGMYELVCGEGRLMAHKKLGRTTVLVEVITCSRKEAYLQSLISSEPRIKRDRMVFARELKRLHDEGMDYRQIARVARRDEHFIRRYIRLAEQGEERPG